MLKGTYDFFSFALLNPDKKFVLAGWTDDPVLYHLSNTVPNVESNMRRCRLFIININICFTALT